MRKSRSLSFRIVIYIFIAQFLVLVMLPFFGALIQAYGFAPNKSSNLNEWGDQRAEDIILRSLHRSPENRLFLEHNNSLEAYLTATPHFQFAAWDARTGSVVDGSSMALIEFAQPLLNADISTMRFKLPGVADSRLVGALRRVETPLGPVVIAVYGYTFSILDVLYTIKRAFTSNILILFLPLTIPVAAIAFYLARRGLAPLRVAATEAARIDVNSLDASISEENVPEEVAPFITAVNEALKRVNQEVAAQRRFLANAAHELRTPITVLCSRIDNPNDATFMRDIKRDARRIRTVVEQLLSVAQISAGKNVINEIADLRRVVFSVVVDYMPLAVGNNRNIEFDQPSVAVMVRCDPHALERVAINLIENACRAEPDGGTVLVRVQSNGSFEVEDHGNGVAIDDREMIFEPFWRKNADTPGTGLGLAISKEIIECHGGRISISETPGGGAMFVVILPKAC
ncbi:MAG: HAMP domain-containing histidine kinase [Alphaproteobacteria bacterium]|nr:HAMP domain-containing histidine kinase [Alphaproteobacteria bacterium]